MMLFDGPAEMLFFLLPFHSLLVKANEVRRLILFVIAALMV